MKHRELSTALQKCPTSLDIRGRQMKATWRLPLPPARMGKISKRTAVNTGQGNLIHCWWACRLVKPLWDQNLPVFTWARAQSKWARGWMQNDIQITCWPAAGEKGPLGCWQRLLRTAWTGNPPTTCWGTESGVPPVASLAFPRVNAAVGSMSWTIWRCPQVRSHYIFACFFSK